VPFICKLVFLLRSDIVLFHLENWTGNHRVENTEKNDDKIIETRKFQASKGRNLVDLNRENFLNCK
jgi:hypothetical protein